MYEKQWYSYFLEGYHTLGLYKHFMKQVWRTSYTIHLNFTRGHINATCDHINVTYDHINVTCDHMIVTCDIMNLANAKFLKSQEA